MWASVCEGVSDCVGRVCRYGLCGEGETTRETLLCVRWGCAILFSVSAVSACACANQRSNMSLSKPHKNHKFPRCNLNLF